MAEVEPPTRPSAPPKGRREARARETHPGRAARAPAGELLSAISALLLLVSMFGLKWFGVVELPTPDGDPGKQSAASAWTELSIVRWFMLLTALVALGAVVLHVSQRLHGAQTDTSLLITLLGSVTAALLFFRLLIDLPSPHSVVDVKLGGFLGLLAAIGIAFGGFESIREQRIRRSRVLKRPQRRADLAIDRPAR